MRVLIVDDSVTFRATIRTALSHEEGIEVAGVAANGKIALAKLENEKIDLVVLDLEMPDMDGLETIRAIKQADFGVRIILFAAPTASAYEKVREALRLGADEFLAKPVGENALGGVEAAVERIRVDLVPRIRLFAQRLPTVPLNPGPSLTQAQGKSWVRKDLTQFHPEAIVIASSTGGPMALEHLFARIRAPLRIPVLIVQHMPPPFTKNLADRLAAISGVPVMEGQAGQSVRAGQVYVAPAGFHMRLEQGSDRRTQIEIYQGPRINYVIPAADPLFETASLIYGPNLMGFILTGMGEDGKLGACAIKNQGGGVMIQDQATSVVWGMPGAVHQAGAFDRMGGIEECASLFANYCSL
ncbi:MAG: chemotaxis-specific protein-glutamate methyltransferase CheB [Oligoflexus sp.]|jgi:two-component system chemotaxis response regulator CheB